MKLLKFISVLSLSFCIGTIYAQSDSINVKTTKVDTAEVDTAKTDSTAKTSKKWKFQGKPGMKVARNSFSNWSSGGITSMALEFDSEFGAYYKHDGKEWKNDLRMQFGVNRNDGEGNRKMIDKLDFRSSLSIEGPNEKFRYSALFNIKSQFANGYDYRSSTQWYLNSGFFAPGYINVDFGIDYIGTKNLVVHLSPLYEKTTVIREKYYDNKVVNEYWGGYEPRFDEDYQEEFQEEFPPLSEDELQPYEDLLASTEMTYGLAWRDNIRFETGAYIQITYDHPDIFKNIDFKSRLDVFASYTNFLEPDLDWEVWTSYNLNKYIALKMNLQLVYDSDILFDDAGAQVPKLQFRDFWGLGLAYTFK